MRLAVQVDLPTPKEPLRNLAHHFSAIHSNVGGVNVICHLCKTRGRVNSKLLKRGQKFTCGSCAVAS